MHGTWGRSVLWTSARTRPRPGFPQIKPGRLDGLEMAGHTLSIWAEALGVTRDSLELRGQWTPGLQPRCELAGQGAGG